MIHQSTGGAAMTSRATSQSYTATFPWKKDSVCKGSGVIVEGVLKDLRTHTLMRVPAGSDLPTRFIALQLSIDRACVRKWKDGVEILPDQTETKIEVKGYLTREKKVFHPESSGRDPEAAAKITSEAMARAPASIFSFSSQKTKLHPSVPGVFEFWADAAVFVVSDFVRGRKYRLKTQGDCPLVEAATRMDDGSEKEVLAYYAGGDEIGDSWNAKINRARQMADAPAKTTALAGPEDERDESEWD